MASKNTDETPAVQNPPQNLEDLAAATRAENQAKLRMAEEDRQKDLAAKNAAAAIEAQKPANKMRRWLDTLRNAKGVEDQRHAHHLVLSEMLQHMLSDMPPEQSKEPADGK